MLAFAFLSWFGWGVSPVCKDLCLKKYHIGIGRWQLIDNVTKVLTTLILTWMGWSEDASGTELDWLDLPLWGVFYALMDGIKQKPSWSTGPPWRLSLRSGPCILSSLDFVIYGLPRWLYENALA